MNREYIVSVPYYLSVVNYSLDTIREEDHKRCLTFFRPGASGETVRIRLKLQDEEICEKREEILNGPAAMKVWKVTKADQNYIMLAAKIILRRCGLKGFGDETPINVYSPSYISLSRAI